MAENRGKQFEAVVKDCFMQLPDVSVDRLHDQTTGYLGSRNICDFIVYREPYEYYFECKTVHGNTFPLSNITKNQWDGMLEKSHIKGVTAGVICWWVDLDVTRFIPIRILAVLKGKGYKSVRYDTETPENCAECMVDIHGKKKRVFFDYDMGRFLDEIQD